MQGTTEWQRVDDTGCFWWVLRWLLLAWAIVIPYAAMTRSLGWLSCAGVCVTAGSWMAWRQRSRGFSRIEDLAVEISSSVLRPGDELAVALRTSGEMARTVRWWRSEFMAGVTGDDPKSMASAEFAVDPEAELGPVAELQMLLTIPDEQALRDVKALEWWVQVTVETERGRVESGKVEINVTP